MPSGKKIGSEILPIDVSDILIKFLGEITFSFIHPSLPLF
jgi:hypothetical protein